MRILGIDCSSTTIGYCVLDVDIGANTIAFIKAGYVKPLKKGGIVERIVDTRNKIQDLIKSEKPDHIGIEEIIQFMQGSSTAKTIIMLTTFNRMVALTAYDCTGRSPDFFSVMSIRHGLKLNKIFPKKEDMPELVAKHLRITFPYELNKKGNLKVENYDKADGMAVALYYAFVLTKRVRRKKGKK